MIEKRWKSTAGSYNHSHKKSAQSLAKYLTRGSVPDTIFSDKRQATSDKRQATSDKRQATSNKRQATSDKQQATSDKRQATSNKQQSGISAQSARVNFHTQQYNFTQNNLGLVRGAASPLNPQLFVGGKRDTCQTQVSLFPPMTPSLFLALPKGTPLWKPHP